MRLNQLATPTLVVCCLVLCLYFGFQFQRREQITGPALPSNPTRRRLIYCNPYNQSQTLKKLNKSNTPTFEYQSSIVTLPSGFRAKMYHWGMADPEISGGMMKDQVWEAEVLQEIVATMKQHPELHYVDVGTNVGLFAMGVATLEPIGSRRVVGVEAVRHTADRTYGSLLLNGLLTHVTLLYNAVSDQRSKVTIKIKTTAHGGSKVVNESFDGKPQNQYTQVDSILMDDLLEVIDFDKAFLKIDIEGHEPRALKHSRQFFKRVHVPIISIEMASFTNTVAADRAWILEYFTSMGYVPTKSVYSTSADLDYAKLGTFNNIFFKKKPFITVRKN